MHTKKNAMIDLLLMLVGACCKADRTWCNSASPGSCPADVTGLLQTKVQVSELEIRDKDMVTEIRKSKILADRAYYNSFMDMSKAKFIAGVPIYNADQMPGGLHPSELQLSEPSIMIGAFTDKPAVETFCANLLAAQNECKCDAVEGAIKEAIFECTESDLDSFIHDEESKGNPVPTFVEPNFNASAFPDFDEKNETPSLLDTGRRGATSIWGIDRIDDLSTTDGDYTIYPGSNEGSQAHVYVADTGIRYDHVDFEGRAQTTAEFLSKTGNPTLCAPDSTTCGYDVHGHGTHVAGTVGGKTYGVAKKVKLYAMKVLNDQGFGSGSDIVASVNWVIANGNKPAVWSASLGGPGTWASYEYAFQSAVANNVVISVAAGNDNDNACDYSPAFAPTAITVGSTTSSDSRSWFSNYGSCLDIWAPGSSIRSASASSTTGWSTKSGTSMACPHVSGVLALFLSDLPTNLQETPGHAESVMKSLSTSGEISDIKSDSPDKFLYTGGGTNPIITPAPTPCSHCPAFLTFNPPDAARSFSSVFSGQASGVGHGRSMLDSAQAWRAAQNTAGEYVVIDMGEVMPIEGAVTQARADSYWEYVTAFTVQYSSDSSSWATVPETLTGSSSTDALEARFTSKVDARYLKLVVQTWNSWVSMRAGILMCLTTCNMVTANPAESSRTYSSVYSGSPGTGHAQSMLDSPKAWCALTVAVGQWMTIDLGELTWIRGIETQSRADAPYQFQAVLSYKVDHSSDGSTWIAIPGTMTGASSTQKLMAALPSVVKARYVRLVVQTWNGHICMRAGVVRCDITPATTATTTTSTPMATTTSIPRATTTSIPMVTTTTQVIISTTISKTTTFNPGATTTITTTIRFAQELKTAIKAVFDREFPKLGDDLADVIRTHKR